MFIDDNRAYDVLERCSDLFPEWKKEDGQFWNKKTGEIVRKNGLVIHDLVYRSYEYDLRHEVDLKG